MNKENLQLMADMLGEVVAGTWKGVPVNHKLKIGPLKLFPERINSFSIETWAEVTDCGYSACAIGHACFDQRFIRQGLSMWDNSPEMTVNGELLTDWEAVSELFGISIPTARVLFYEHHYSGYIKYGVTPKRVKSRVEELLLIGGAELVEKYPVIQPNDELSRQRPEPNE